MPDTAPAALPEPAQWLWDQVCTVVEAWHGKDVFDLYRDHSPEMQQIKAAIAALATPKAQRAEGWVSVSITIAPPRGDVLVYFQNRIGILEWDGEWRWGDGSRMSPQAWSEITHWMPLPAPPLAAAQPPKEAM